MYTGLFPYVVVWWSSCSQRDFRGRDFSSRLGILTFFYVCASKGDDVLTSGKNCVINILTLLGEMKPSERVSVTTFCSVISERHQLMNHWCNMTLVSFLLAEKQFGWRLLTWLTCERWLFINFQYLQRPHLRIVVENIPHCLAMSWLCKTDEIMVLCLECISYLAVILIETFSKCETKIFHFVNDKSRNETFSLNYWLLLEETADQRR